MIIRMMLTIIIIIIIIIIVIIIIIIISIMTESIANHLLISMQQNNSCFITKVSSVQIQLQIKACRMQSPWLRDAPNIRSLNYNTTNYVHNDKSFIS